jgi:hypothetical protein
MTWKTASGIASILLVGGLAVEMCVLGAWPAAVFLLIGLALLGPPTIGDEFDLDRLRGRRPQVWEAAKKIASEAADENRALTTEEQGQWDAYNKDLDKLR